MKLGIPSIFSNRSIEAHQETGINDKEWLVDYHLKISTLKIRTYHMIFTAPPETQHIDVLFKI